LAIRAKRAPKKITNDSPKDLKFFRVILSSVAKGVFTLDCNRIIASFNPAPEKITGMPAE
jgi:PAS domain-containing protein